MVMAGNARAIGAGIEISEGVIHFGDSMISPE